MDYGGAFRTGRGGCFRVVYGVNGWPVRCPGPVTVEGWFVDGKGKAHRVDACAQHAGQLRKRGQTQTAPHPKAGG